MLYTLLLIKKNQYQYHMSTCELNIYNILTFLLTSSISDNIAFSLSFRKKLSISESAIGCSGSNVLLELRVSSFCEICCKSIPLEPNSKCLKKN